MVRRRAARTARKSDFGTAMLFVAPFTIGFLVFILYPTVMSCYYSFTEFNALKPPAFVGLANYARLFSDKVFARAMQNTLYMLVLGVPLVCGAGLLIAVALNRKVPLQGLFRTVIYLPAIIPAVAVALIWTWILNPEYGLLNALLGFVGLPKIGWLADPAWSKLSLLFMSVWGVGNVMVMYLAALQDVPAELYESADIDGAGAARKFFSITIPMIKPVMMYNIITTVIVFLQYFSQAYVANNVLSPTGSLNIGTPVNSTMFYGSYIYQNAFKFFKFGYASAMAWILLIVSLGVTFLLIKSSNMLGGDE